jgi:hypothetical protein
MPNVGERIHHYGPYVLDAVVLGLELGLYLVLNNLARQRIEITDIFQDLHNAALGWLQWPRRRPRQKGVPTLLDPLRCMSSLEARAGQD